MGVKKQNREAKNHLRSLGSFKFALNAALLAVLVALLVTLVSQVGIEQLVESRAAGY
jgi:hypothetical protein